MKSFCLGIAGAVGLAFCPLPWNVAGLTGRPARAEAAAKQPPSTWSRSNSIRLPLQMDERTRSNLSEIRLFVKTPDTDWALAQSSPPTLTSFDYRAPKDGVYSFMFVTVDKSGRSFPADLKSRPPHQLIVVDTTPPELTVIPMPVAREIFLQCRMDDANSDRSSIKLEYPVGDNAWQSMELAQADTPGVFRIPNAGVLEGKVRATGKDRAGNLTQRIIDLGDATKSFVAGAPQQTAILPPDAVKAEAPTPPGIPVTSNAVDIDIPLPPGASTQQTSAKIGETSDVKVPAAVAQTPAPTSSYNPNRLRVITPADLAPPPEVVPVSATTSVPEAPKTPVTNVNQKLPTAGVDPYFPPIQLPATPPSTEVVAPVAEQSAPKSEPSAPKNEATVAKSEEHATHAEQLTENRPAPASAKTHDIINTPRCTIDYAVENLPVAAPMKVEFWATRDNGRTWVRVHDEAGGRAPAKLVLPGDGFYGIRVKANGSNQSPHMGEAPDAWVEVDTTRPTVRLLPPTIGVGADAGTLTIPWVAHDKNLVADSINIYYANQPDGPWSPVVTGLRNEGSYRWLIPGGIGTDIYLRLEATDRAGNVGQCEIRDPVSLPQPKIRVLGIGPTR